MMKAARKTSEKIFSGILAYGQKTMIQNGASHSGPRSRSTGRNSKTQIRRLRTDARKRPEIFSSRSCRKRSKYLINRMIENTKAEITVDAMSKSKYFESHCNLPASVARGAKIPCKVALAAGIKDFIPLER